VDAFLMGLTLKTMPFQAPFRNTRLELSYFHRDGGDAPDRGPFAQAGTSIFEPRYAFRKAFSVAVFSPLSDSWSRSFLCSLRFVVDTIHEGNILQTDLYYLPVARTYLNLGLDVLGSDSTTAVDFISRYQRNDRVRAGVAYVF
jgi:hypothetical protein